MTHYLISSDHKIQFSLFFAVITCFSILGKINTIDALGSYHGSSTSAANLEEIIVAFYFLPAILLDSFFIKVVFLSADRNESLYGMSGLIIVVDISAGFAVKLVAVF